MAGPKVPEGGALARPDVKLARQALAVLNENWLGHATRPGGLYPHQWSWDTACIAMGRTAWDQDHAARELRFLFAGQWSNGLLPHIVFTDADRYFPGPSFWQTERSGEAPAGRRTSGIVQHRPWWRTVCRRLRTIGIVGRRSVIVAREAGVTRAPGGRCMVACARRESSR